MLSREKLEAYLEKEDIEYHLDEEDPDRILVVFEGRMMGILDRSEATAERLGLMMAGARQSAG